MVLWEEGDLSDLIFMLQMMNSLYYYCAEFRIKNDEFRIKDDEFRIKNDGFRITNDEFCISNDEFRISNALR